MREASLQELQSVQAGLLRRFAGWCGENGLRVFLAYGTLLGAARHGGFIPWDDDTDVWMLREDYERMLEMEAPAGTFFVRETDPDSIWCFTKLCAEGTFFDETALNGLSPKRYGIYVDIFPLDCAASPGAAKRKSLLCRLLVRAFLFGHVTYASASRTLPMRIARRLLHFICGLASKQGYAKAIRRCSMSGRTGGAWRLVASELEFQAFDGAHFSGAERLTFEGAEFDAPLRHEDLLAQLYGDTWRTPIKRKADTHGKAYVQDGFCLDQAK
ncbi:MAG: LicD family protein [Mailhella sp.]|nr:LicD family protein [Mailhella sp.]